MDLHKNNPLIRQAVQNGVHSDAAKSFWSSYLVTPDLSFFPPSADSTVIPRHDASTQLKFPWEGSPPANIAEATLCKVAWALVAGTYSGSRDVIFGTANPLPPPASVSNQESGASSNAFQQTVPCRVRWEASTTVTNLLETVSGQDAEMPPLNSYGLEEIGQISADSRSACQFTCHFSVESRPDATSLASGRTPTTIDDQDSAMKKRYPLLIKCMVGRGEMSITAHSNSRVLDKERLIRCVTLLKQTILAMSSHAQSRVSALEIVTESEYQQILDWNSENPSVVHELAHNLFRRQARAQPNHLALSSWDGNMTYAELDDASDRLSVSLEALGVGPEVMVPICFEKSLWAIVAMLGVLKSGGAFAVVEPSHPLDRKTAIVQQLSDMVALVGAETETSFPAECVRTVVKCDASILQMPKPARVPQSGRPENAMYVIFTSGSTGLPKGCVTEHWSFCSSSSEFRRRTGLRSDDNVLQFASYSFDTSCEEIFCCLFAGATLHIPSEWSRINDLAGELQRTKTTWVELSPKVLSLLVPEEVPSLQTIILGGDRCHGSDICRWPSSIQIINSYGCTEASVTSTLAFLQSRENEEPPIGKAVGSRTWIVSSDDHNKLVPIGAPGELLVEGPGLARGYLGDADRTAKSFVTQPSWATSGDTPRRFYKTGDIVQYDRDGALLYRGRKDTQIKLRGQRIELGEIEHQLSKAIPNALVAAEIATMQPGSTNPDTIVAFTVFGDDIDMSAEVSVSVDTESFAKLAGLRLHLTAELARSLPPYMVPTIFIPLTRMPLTISAKWDRRKLRQIAESLHGSELAKLQGLDSVKKQPQSAAEAKIQALWAKVLSVAPDTIGMDDHFFMIGGNSIQAMRAVAGARAQGLKISVADIFQAPKLRDLAARTTVAEGQAAEETIPAFSLLPEEDRTSIITEAATLCQIKPAEVQDMYECTPLQEGLISLSVKQPGSYIFRQAFHLDTDVRLPDFHRAWEDVIEAHPILRTRIVNIGSTMFQVVTTTPVYWETSISLDRYIELSREQRVELGAPLSHFAIIPSYDGFYFVITLHHVLFDGWSFLLLLNDFKAAYTEKYKRRDKVVPGFNRFIKHLRGLDRAAADAYWSLYLKGSSTTFPAPLWGKQMPQPTATVVDSTDFAVQTIDGSTPTSVLYAAWALLTRSYTGDSDVTFGTTLSGRIVSLRGIEDISGPTIATVPFRLRWGPESTVSTRSLLRTVQQTLEEMRQFEQTGLQRISSLSRDAHAACQFGPLIVVQPESGAGDEEDDQHLAGIMRHHSIWKEIPEEIASQAIVVECDLFEQTGFVRVKMRYDPDLVEAPLATAIARQFIHILRQLVDPNRLDQPLSLISKVNDVDYQLMNAWNDGRINPVRKTMHELFQVSAVVHAHSPAISSWDGEMTYAQLDAASDQVAKHLRGLGVGAGKKGESELVLLCFEKSRWAIVSALAILKAGAAFAALDPAQPEARHIAIAALAKARVVLTSKGLVDRLSGIFGRKLQILSTPELTEPFSVPKGVMISHGAASSSITSHAAAFGVNELCRTLQFASMTFDACIFEIFTTLTTGGCVCIPSDAQRVNDLAGAINSFSVDTVMLTPSVLSLLSPGAVPSVRSVIFIAEQVTNTDIQRWSGQCRVMNGYGPTECTVVCVVNPNLREGGRIGYATGCRAWVVEPDDVDRLVPIGCAGELLIEGPSLAIGYLNDGEKTRASFIKDPKWAMDGTPNAPIERRFYKTGDLVQQTSDGSYKYIGRKDTQVKLRGQRIELGEIDFHIRQALPSVVVRSDTIQLQNQKKSDARTTALAAFVEVGECQSDLVSGDSLSDELLKRMGEIVSTVVPGLVSSLPAYMIPSIFIPVHEMPLTLSGKTDRQRLKALADTLSYDQLESLRVLREGAQGQGPKVGPRTDAEKRMRSAWAKVLLLEPETIGVHDSFFGLGGDSIAAMKLVTAARSEGLQTSVADIFQSPRQVVNAGLMSLSVKEKGSYIVRNVFRLRGIDLRRFQRAWEYVARAHPILRTRLVHLETYGTLQAVLSTKPAIIWRAASSLKEYFAEEEKEAIGLGTPLSRYGLVRPADQVNDAFFVWTTHHAMYDGWSMPLIKEAVAMAYTDTIVSESPAFKTFIKYIEDMDRESAASFWRQHLDKATASAFPILPKTSTSGQRAMRTENVAIPWTGKPHEGITMSTLLRTAYALVVGKYTASRDVVFGTTLSGRNAPVADVEAIVGPTIATVPVRLSWDEDTLVQDLLVQSQRLSTQTIPFEQIGLQEIAKVSPSARSACQFQSILVVQPEGGEESPECSSLFGEEQDITTLSQLLDDESSFQQTYPLGIEITASKGELQITATFDNIIMHCEEVRRILFQLSHAAKLLIQQPRALVASLDLVSPEDIHANARPTSTAVSAWDGSLTYAELTRLSNGLAHRLRGLGVGVGKETIVAFSYEKSKMVPIIMLAILKAGGAFVALDAAQPVSRLHSIIEQADVAILVSSPALVRTSSLADLALTPVYPEQLTYTASEQASVPLPAHPVPVPNSLAYLIFTSGSTGVPKGVMVSHSATASSTLAHGSAMGITRNSRVLQFSSYTFDASILEVFGSLLAGACVCIPSQAECSELNDTVHKYAANFVALTPRVASILRPDEHPAITAVALGAEVVSPADIWRWGPRRVSNGYGPTECTVVCVLEASNHKPGRIGKGVGSICWVVDPDDHHRLAPVGAPGELLIEGPCLARGYINQEDRTRGSFVENPAWTKYIRSGDEATRRFYKTGDSVRYDADGGILFLGRKDTQAKLRGQRIELSEVEYHLEKLLPPGSQVVVEIVTFPQNQKSEQQDDHVALVAFIVPLINQALSSRGKYDEDLILDLESEPALRLKEVWHTASTAISQMVPSYMVPSMYIPLHAIPLSSSSKTDRPKLQRVAQGLSREDLDTLRGVRGEKERPRTSLEHTMAELWARILGLEPDEVGIKDSFFRLGGDSITAMRLVSALAHIDIALRVSDIFKFPVLESLCEHLQGEEAKGDTSSLGSDWCDVDTIASEVVEQAIKTISYNTNRRSGPASMSRATLEEKCRVVPATDFQEWAFEFACLKKRGFVNYFALDLFEPFGKVRVREACQQLVRHHEILRTYLKLADGRLWQLIVPPELAEPDIELYRIAEDDSVSSFGAQLIKIDEARRLGSASNPTKFFIIQSRASMQLVIRLGHTHYDGLSFPILLQTLTELLRCSRLTPIITPSAVAVNDGVVGLLTRLVPLPDLSTANITLASLMKAAWALVLAQHAATSDVVFGCLVSGRMAQVPDIEAVVGPCVTITPARVQVPAVETGSTRAYVQMVHELHTRSMEYEHVGFKRIAAAATSWPARTSLASASIVQHQNIPLAAELNDLLPGLPFELSAKGSTANAAAIWIITTTRPAESLLSIDFEYARHTVGHAIADTLLQALCVAVEHLGQNYNADVPLPNTLCLAQAAAKTPLLPCGRNAKGYDAREVSHLPLSIPDVDMQAARALEEEAWATARATLTHTPSKPKEPSDDLTSIFEIWDDNLVAVGFQEIYDSLGVYLDVEEILSCPSMEAQETLVAATQFGM
ncbi:uncharacterized protein PG998_011919 [Apiospora kogelbergensis]|uniref:uncharacterized protein n=1 Tax=Apiospora kogelbergensis TaxID=1337665 RepID=UPI0031328857